MILVVCSHLNFFQLDLKLNPKIGLNHHHPTPNFSQAYRHKMRIRFGKTKDKRLEIRAKLRY